MKIARIYIFLCWVLTLFSACMQDELFNISSGGRLSFSVDTLRLDTVFSNTSTPTKSFWAYNHNVKGVKCRSVRLERGNQLGFQVNVDGIFLGSNLGYQTNEIAVREQDSIRIYVKVLATATQEKDPQLLTDNLIFTYDDGKEQKINLRAWAWDARVLRSLQVKKDTTISSQTPIVVYGGITVNENSVLTIAEGTTLYFHSGAALNVKGTLLCKGTSTNNVVLRGDRLDKLFENLPYDRVSGQWKGIKIASSSYGNKLEFTDIHSTFTGIEVDSSDVSKEKLTLNAVSIHNCLGDGLRATNANISVINSQISNAQKNCLAVIGGKTLLNACTIAQFYPFTSQRGVALWVDDKNKRVERFECINSLITGLSSDEMSILIDAKNKDFSAFTLKNNVMRTPKIENFSGAQLENIFYEVPNDTIIGGRKNFKQIDFTNMKFDFNLSKTSLAIGKANALSLPTHDRNGTERLNHNDVGAYILKEQ